MVSTVMIAPSPSKLSSYWWNHLISPVRVTIASTAPVCGHGLCLLYGMGGFRVLILFLCFADRAAWYKLRQ